MIECLVKDSAGELDVHIEVLERAIRPSIPYTVGPGKWTIDVGADHFVDFSPEPPGLQISFDDGIDRQLAERVAEEVAANLVSLTGSTFHVVWLS